MTAAAPASGRGGAGMTPFEAIRAGTADAATFLHQENEFCVIAVGRRADLLLLNANPLSDVKNVSKRIGVAVNGQWFTEEQLKQLLDELRASYQHQSRKQVLLPHRAAKSHDTILTGLSIEPPERKAP
jgi:adenine deaminase